MKQFLTLSLLGLLALSSCQKQGCKDTNSVNYDPEATEHDGLCQYLYISDIQVNKLVAYNEDAPDDNTTWDKPDKDAFAYPDEEYPDIEIRLKKGLTTSHEYLYYSKTVHNNKQYPLVVSVPFQPEAFIERDIFSTYTLEIVDKDPEGVETVYERPFDYDDIENNQLVFRKYEENSNGVEEAVTEVTINFVVR